MRRCLPLLVILLAALSLNAHLPEYSPFPPKEGPKLFPVEELMGWSPEQWNGSHYFNEKNRTRSSTKPILRVSSRKPDADVDLTVLTAAMKPVAGPFHVSSSPVIPSGYSADLNADGTTDYILTISYGAVGAIGGGARDVVFVLSDGAQYKVSMLGSTYPGPNDFLDVAGTFHFIRSGVWGLGEKIRGKDGRPHNYWVYNLLTVDGSTLKPADSAVPGFPKWILWTFRPNHDETDQFTLEEKRRLIDFDALCIVSTPEKPCPGYFQ